MFFGCWSSYKKTEKAEKSVENLRGNILMTISKS